MKKSVRFTKSIISIILALLLVLTTMTVSFAKNVEVSKTGWTISSAYVHIGYDSNWWDTSAFGSKGELEVTLDANKTYKFKIVSDSKWLGNNGTMTSSNCTGWNFNENDGDAGITTTIAGKYIFKAEDNGSQIRLSVTYPTAPVDPDPSGDTYKIYFSDSNKWGNAYCYVYGASGREYLGAWPGKEMTKAYIDDFGNQIYSYEIPVEAKNLIFNDGKKDGAKQTKTISSGIDSYIGWYPNNQENPCDVGSWKVTTDDEYVLCVDDKEYKMSNSTVTVQLTAQEHSIKINKYNQSELKNSYFLPENVSGEKFSKTLITIDNSNKFTPSTEGKYIFSYDKSMFKLTCDKAVEKTFYFLDSTEDNWIYSDDADMWITTDGGTTFTLMNETIDKLSGVRTWVSDSMEPADLNVYFVRANRLYRKEASSTEPDNESWFKNHKLSINEDEGYVYNVWKAQYTTDVKNGEAIYVVRPNDIEGWSTKAKVEVPDGSANDYTWGLYCDTKGEGNTEDFVKLYTSQSLCYDPRPTNYTLFLPSYTDLSKAKIYSAFNESNIKGGKYSQEKSLTKGLNELELSNGTEYTVNYRNVQGETFKTFKVKVLKSTDTASMLMNTKQDLYTKTTNSLYTQGFTSEYKEAIVDKKGTYKFISEDGKQLNKENVIKKIKGRGNSSWEASMRIYGKYAYNINLDKKAPLIDGANSSKKYCLLANNMDESACRNTLIYNIAEEAGSLYVPKTRLIDLFDNGNYLGSYIISEKVEYGKDTMMQTAPNGETVQSMDSYNEDTATADGSLIDYDNLSRKTSTYKNYKYQYNAFVVNNEDLYDKALTDYKDYDYLLEFELESRYQNEASWIETPNGQHICIKYPEFASDSEMKSFIDDLAPVWEAVYNNNYSGYKDLIDVNSFAKTYLVQELSENLDSSATSYYIAGGVNFDKLVAAPLWDYDWALGDYYKNKWTKDSYVNMDNPNQLFVKNKSMKTEEGDKALQSTLCFEAKLANNSSFIEVCKAQWTNTFVPALNKYIDNGYLNNDKGEYTPSKILLKEILPHFKSSMSLNEVRWNQMGNLYYDLEHSQEEVPRKSTLEWGTKITSTYVKQKYNFAPGKNIASGASIDYENTLYYLNDWIATRWNYMSGQLWDDNSKYGISDAKFTASLSKDPEGELNNIFTLDSVSATATQNKTAVDNSKLFINVYVNNELMYTVPLTDIKSKSVKLEEGTSKVYVEVFIDGFTNINTKSEEKEFSVADPTKEFDLPIYFKSVVPKDSSVAKDYVPKLNDVEMTKDEIIGTDYTETEDIYWFKTTVKSKIGDDVTLSFSTAKLSAKEIKITGVKNQSYYFAVNDLDNGDEIVDITDSLVKKSFIGNKNHMIINEYKNGETPLVSRIKIDGKIYEHGDSNKDGNFSIVDATLIQRNLASLYEFDEISELLADFDLDGVDTIADVTAIQKRIAHIK